MTTHQDGGTTRNATAGAKRTNPADHTNPSAPRYAINPTAAAIFADTSASGTMAMPASCATAISGIAKKLSASPAKVTLENSRAAAGISAASVAADAINKDTSGATRR